MGRQKTGIKIKCIICGNFYYVRPSRSLTSNYCSKKCYGVAVGNRTRGTVIDLAGKYVNRLCPTCGTIFTNNNLSVKYCSHECFTKTRKGVSRSTDDEKLKLKKLRDSRHNHIKRARKRNCVSEKFDSIEIFKRDDWKCYLCGDKIDPKFKWPHPKSPSLDHIIPLSLGGNHLRTNTMATHLKCNLSKHTRSQQEQLLLFG